MSANPFTTSVSDIPSLTYLGSLQLVSEMESLDQKSDRGSSDDELGLSLLNDTEGSDSNIELCLSDQEESASDERSVFGSSELMVDAEGVEELVVAASPAQQHREEDAEDPASGGGFEEQQEDANVTGTLYLRRLEFESLEGVLEVLEQYRKKFGSCISFYRLFSSRACD